jgi:hypothetical protein
MKNLIYIILLFCFQIVFSQSPIKAIRNWNGEISNNSYLKDTFNDLDLFVGTFKYSNNDTTFTIKLRKIEQYYNGKYFSDLIIGDLTYIIGSTTIIDSNNQFNTNFNNQFTHKIFGESLYENNFKPICSDCLPNEKRLRLQINDGTKSSALYPRKVTINGYQALKVLKITSGPKSVPFGTTPIKSNIRDGDYLFIKQP